MSKRIKITATVSLPDRMKIARFARAPELGPKILFFSGGSALNPLSRELIQYTHNSIHIITTFDSGGSSATLRKAFNMPAVGDLRNRLMALSDQSIRGNPEVVNLFSFRFPHDLENSVLAEKLDAMVSGDDELVAAVPDPFRKIIRTHLGFFQKAMPADFDLKGASLGNLVLTGGYLNNDLHLDPVAYLFAKLAEVRGVVRPILNTDLHLAAEFEDGGVIVGQHNITGRETEPISTPIKKMYLVDGLDGVEPVRPAIRQKTKKLIAQADLICYPIGSFYSSVVANLLPGGVAETIAGVERPKVYVPNTGVDKEMPGVTVEESVRLLIEYLKNGSEESIETNDVLDFVLLDSKSGAYAIPPDIQAIDSLGVRVIDTDLVSISSRPFIDPRLLAEILLSLS